MRNGIFDSVAHAGGDQGILSRILSLGGFDPANQMPREPNQQPAPGQRKPLPTARVQSSIPKGGTDSSWLYPSPQMFYNGAKFAAWGLASRFVPPVTFFASLSNSLPCPAMLSVGERAAAALCRGSVRP